MPPTPQRDVLDSERIALPRQPSWRQTEEEAAAAAERKRRQASLSQSFEQPGASAHPGVMEFSKRRHMEKRLSRLNSDPQLLAGVSPQPMEYRPYPAYMGHPVAMQAGLEA